MKTIVKIFNETHTLIKHISEKYQNWPGYIFRGQSNEKWLLESSLSRELKTIDDLEERDNIMNKHYLNFKKRHYRETWSKSS